MSEITHRTIETNGIRMHVAEQGTGPLVILCHGFPESWYSWRHQLAALADAGFHAVAPDMRGYGQTDAPTEIESYTLLHLVGDMVGLVDALGEKTAVIAGHDWGAPVAWHAALLRPDCFRGVIGLSVPFRPRGTVRPTHRHAADRGGGVLSALLPDAGSGRGRAAARRALHDAPARVLRLRRRRSGHSADSIAMVPRERRLPRHRRSIRRRCRRGSPRPTSTSTRGSSARTGFRGGLNWYRNIDRNWELLAPFAGALVTVPALYVAGDRDLVVQFRGMDQLIPNLSTFVPKLRRTIMLPGCGHWTQQERAREVNAAMLEFLKGLGSR